MDWEKVDLTLDAIIGGDEQPSMLAWEVRRAAHSNLYQDLFRTDREGIIAIVDDYELGRQPILNREDVEFAEELAANRFMGIFGRFPHWAKSQWGFLNGAMSGGDCCERCMTVMNLLNSSGPSCCDLCEAEMNEQISADPDVVFAFERSGQRAVA